jgi:hypothetical protein
MNLKILLNTQFSNYHNSIIGQTKTEEMQELKELIKLKPKTLSNIEELKDFTSAMDERVNRHQKILLDP